MLHIIMRLKFETAEALSLQYRNHKKTKFYIGISFKKLVLTRIKWFYSKIDYTLQWIITQNIVPSNDSHIMKLLLFKD